MNRQSPGLTEATPTDRAHERLRVGMNMPIKHAMSASGKKTTNLAPRTM